MLNQDYFHVDFEKYAPVFPSYPGSASNERLSDVMVKIKYDHANDDYYYLPGIEFLQKMMKEMNSSKKSKKLNSPVFGELV